MKLTIELARQLKTGDYVEYIYLATRLNPKDVIHKFTFLELATSDENEKNRLNNKVVNVPAIKLRWLNEWEDSFGYTEVGSINIPSEVGGNSFKVWRNGWCDVEIIRINEKTFERE